MSKFIKDFPKKIIFFHAPPGCGQHFLNGLIIKSCEYSNHTINGEFKFNDHNMEYSPSKQSYLKYPRTNLLDKMEAHEIEKIYITSIATSLSWILNSPQRPEGMSMKKYFEYYKKKINFIIKDEWTISDDKIMYLNDTPLFKFIDLTPGSNTPRRYKFLDNFPFLDHVMNKEYDLIINWIKKEFGNNLDFNFIKKELIQFREKKYEKCSL